MPKLLLALLFSALAAPALAADCGAASKAFTDSAALADRAIEQVRERQLDWQAVAARGDDKRPEYAKAQASLDGFLKALTAYLADGTAASPIAEACGGGSVVDDKGIASLEKATADAAAVATAAQDYVAAYSALPAN